MFDIGFAELLIIAVVSLLVIGPERLPGAIRTGSAWLNRFRRGFNDIKQEVQQELHNDAVLRELRESGEKLRRETESLQRDFASTATGDESPGASTPGQGRDRPWQNGADDTETLTAARQSAGHRETPAPFLRGDSRSDPGSEVPPERPAEPSDRGSGAAASTAAEQPDALDPSGPAASAGDTTAAEGSGRSS